MTNMLLKIGLSSLLLGTLLWSAAVAGQPMVGVNATEFNGGLYVTETVQCSPAEAAGLQRGHLILSVDGVSVSTIHQFQTLVRASGNEVAIRVRHFDHRDYDLVLPVIDSEVLIARMEARARMLAGEIGQAYRDRSLVRDTRSQLRSSVVAPDAGLNTYDDSPNTYRYHRGLLK